ncbi:10552_t:CDS:2 [Acaulospora morrowiae]|uniref:10552_t:CDS:1 n=1 Tax=Acaulospora morrowiae TaxID=94023 RepID=A0A9N9G6A2_9GLOM|nr:10552_t:CDS:2 [Acaulospora morrowiae]
MYVCKIRPFSSRSLFTRVLYSTTSTTNTANSSNNKSNEQSTKNKSNKKPNTDTKPYNRTEQSVSGTTNQIANTETAYDRDNVQPEEEIEKMKKHNKKDALEWSAANKQALCPSLVAFDIFNEKTEKELMASYVKEKLGFLLTKRFLLITILGQFLAFCITTTIVTSTKLLQENASFPVTQSALTYFTLFLIYTPITIKQLGWRGYVEMIKNNGLKYIVLSIIDVEGNYFVVLAYNYTSPLSITLLDAWAIFVVVILAIVFLKVKYHWSQYLGVFICLVGIALVFGGDFMSGNKGDFSQATSPVRGDFLCLIGATFYGLSNTFEEYYVRKRPFYEVVGQMGLWGTIISVLQLTALEIDALEATPWNGAIAGYLIAYNFAMVCLYTLAPILFRMASATYFNLALLASDFYTLLFSLYILDYKMTSLYPAAFVCTIVGLITYYIYPSEPPKVEQQEDFTKENYTRDIENNDRVLVTNHDAVLDTNNEAVLREEKNSESIEIVT